MPFVQAVIARPHTVGRFRAAAWARFHEANRLAVDADLFERDGLRHGAVYLFGYVAEMLLKAAYFRLRPAGANGTITFAHLQAARSRAIQLQLHWPGNLHSLVGWRNLLARERLVMGAPFPQTFEIELFAQTTRLALLWSESMRYYHTKPTRVEIHDAHEAARWLLTRFSVL